MSRSINVVGWLELKIRLGWQAENIGEPTAGSGDGSEPFELRELMDSY